jgi:RimJ/RimL family protein N-acetyltransferase
MRDLSEIRELPELTDGRLTVRPYRPDDAASVAAMCQDETALHWLPMPDPYHIEDAEWWIGDAGRRWSEEHMASWPVCDAAGGELLGSTSVRISVRDENGDIGYLVKRAARRRGVARGMVALVVDWCFDELGLGRLQIRCDPRNEASRLTILSCGFQVEGLLRSENLVRGERTDSLVASLLPGDPRPRRERREEAQR